MANEYFVTAITTAIGAHWMWKARLKAAIASKRLETPVSIIAKEDECVFGKWLVGKDFPPDEKLGVPYRRVSELHARFHKAAAEVATLVTQGRGVEAHALMDTGAYAKISAELTEAMLEWKNTAGIPHTPPGSVPQIVRHA